MIARRRSRRRRWALLDCLIVLALGTIALAILAPGINGILLQPAIDGALARATTAGVRWRSLARVRGWFDTRLSLELAPAGYRAQRFELILAHGPAWRTLAEGQGSPLVLASLAARREGEPVASARLHYGGDWQAQLQAAALALMPLDDAWPIELRQLRAALDYRSTGHRLAVRAGAASLDLPGLAVGDAALLGEYRLDTSGWWFGETSLRAAALNAGALSLSLDGLELTAASTPGAGQVTANLALRAARLQVPEQAPGSLSVDAGVRRVSLPALRRWWRGGARSRDLLSGPLAGASVHVSPLTWREVQGEAGAAGAVLLRADANARVPPAATARDDVELTLELAAAESFARAVFRQAAARMLGRSTLFGKLSELEREDRGAIAHDSAARQLSVLAAQGYLSLTGGVYRTRLNHRAGEWSLNGRVLNVR